MNFVCHVTSLYVAIILGKLIVSELVYSADFTEPESSQQTTTGSFLTSHFSTMPFTNIL